MADSNKPIVIEPGQLFDSKIRSDTKDFETKPATASQWMPEP